MTIPTLRGLTEETANLPALGKSLADLFSGGNSELQQKLREAIAQDPSVAENLAQLSRDNPQLFGALRLGKFGESIAKTPEGYKQQRERQTLQAGELANTQAGLNITQSQNENSLAPVRASILNYQNAALKRDQAKAEEAAKGFPDINFKKAVDDFTKGEQSPDVLKALSNPQAMQLFQSMVGYKKAGEAQAAADERQRITQQGLYDRFYRREDRANEKKLIDEGTQFFKKFGVGSPQTWAQYLGDPSIQSTVEDLVQNGLPAGHENDEHLRNLRAIGVALKQDRSIKLDAASRQNTIAADRLLKDITTGKVNRDLGLNQVNGLLSENAQNRGTRQIMLVTGDQVAGASSLGKIFNRNKIVAVDPITHEKLADVGNDIGAIDKFTNQPPTSQYTPQDLAQARAALPNATPKDLSDLQKLHPLVYQALLPEIQRLEQQKKANKGTK